MLLYIKHRTVSQSHARWVRRPADCGLFFFSAVGPSNQIAGLQPPPPPCRIWQSFKTSAGMSVCVLCPWQRANRGCHEKAGQWWRRKENSNERGEKEWWREQRGKGENSVSEIWRVRVGVCEFHKRSFVWQMVFLGLLGMLGLGIPQIIQPGHTRLA